MNPRIAILKPDHLGDFVLATPAVQAVVNYFGNVTLYVSSATLGLARFLFGDLNIRTIEFPHLSKWTNPPIDLGQLADELGVYELVFCLRDDGIMRELLGRLAVPFELAEGGHLTHDTAIHKRAVCRHVPNYSRTALFRGKPVTWAERVRHVALCVAAGYPTNRWPNAYWLELAWRLAERGIQLSLVGGPSERRDLQLLSALMINIPHRVTEGGSDFGAFLRRIDEVDLVIASDGGTAHLCSLCKPVLSIFGSSPWRRYAPFGRNNVLMTRDLPCCPCVQFSTTEVNGCVTRECMALITPAQVLQVMDSNGADFSSVRGIRVERGTSHAFEQ